MATVASVYAKAVFQLAQERGAVDAVLSDMRAFLEMSESNPSLREVLGGPSFNPNARKSVLDQVLLAAGIKGSVARLLELLVARGRFSTFGALVQEFERFVEESQGIRSGSVRSAVELTAEELTVLGAALAKRIGGRVRLSQKVDPSLLGGVVATVNGKTFDASLKTQLDRFKSELI